MKSISQPNTPATATNATAATTTSQAQNGNTTCLLVPDGKGPASQGILTVSPAPNQGFTNCTVVVEKIISNSSVWQGLALYNEQTGVRYNSGSATPPDNAISSFRFDCAGEKAIRAYVLSAGSLTGMVMTLEAGTTAEFGSAPLSPLAVTNATSIGVAGAMTSVAGTMQSTEVTQMGSAPNGTVLGVFREEGNIAAVAGNPVAGNGADTTDDILWGVQVPASIFDQPSRQLNLLFQGLTGANTNNKRFKVFANPTMSGQTVTGGVISGGTVTAGTPILDSGAWVNGTTPNNAVAFSGNVQITKYGATGSNTQMTGQAFTVLGNTHTGMQIGQALTLPENAVINIVITGSSYTTGAAGDVKLQTATLTGSN